MESPEFRHWNFISLNCHLNTTIYSEFVYQYSWILK